MPDVSRAPRPTHQGRNGFTDPVRQAVQGLVNMPNLHPIASDPDILNRHPAEKRAIWDAIEEHHFMETVLEVEGSYWPGLEAAKAATKEPETSASVAKTISALKEKHAAEMRRICAVQGQTYHEEALQRYLSKDDEVLIPEAEKHYLMAAHSRYPPTVATLDDQLAALQYAHLKTLAPLLQKRARLAAEEDAARRRLEAQFPDTIARWHSFSNKDAKLRVSRFLMAPKGEQEQMLSKFGWAWRQTEPLRLEYEKNPSFKSAVHDLVREVEAHDPRRRPSAQMSL
ncbi:hypothetical protein OBBRIDRAFT_782384 [Obba rivulosa]|uniref:Uncharacterized protein n=1 Tax=Obba rivulosa TaxID=1052685 RepID=A0A8E2APC5_9APHY|nr:hypothetical protein OBBRIDRAFT_782384 [Obba rivulosa]